MVLFQLSERFMIRELCLDSLSEGLSWGAGGGTGGEEMPPGAKEDTNSTSVDI